MHRPVWTTPNRSSCWVAFLSITVAPDFPIFQRNIFKNLKQKTKNKKRGEGWAKNNWQFLESLQLEPSVALNESTLENSFGVLLLLLSLLLFFFNERVYTRMCVAARTSNEGVAIHRNKLPTSFLFQLLNTFQITRSNKSISSVFFLIPSPLNIWLSLIPFSKERRKKKEMSFHGKSSSSGVNHLFFQLDTHVADWMRHPTRFSSSQWPIYF